MSVMKSTSEILTVSDLLNNDTTVLPYDMYDGRTHLNYELATTGVYGSQTTITEVSHKVAPVIPESLRLVLAIFLFVVFFIGVIGNVTVIWVFTRTRALRTPNNVLIINLACSDLLMVLTMFPVMFVAVAKKRWIFGEIGCDAYAFCGSLFGIGSLSILTAIAYDRRCAICSANTGPGTGSYRRVYFLASIAWMYSFFWSVLPLTGKGGFVAEGYQLNCSFNYISQSLQNKLYVGFLFAGAFFIPMMIILYSYSRVVVAVKKSQQSLLDLGKSAFAVRTFRRHKRQVRNYETAKIGMKLITMFLLSWGPYACVAFIAQFVNPHVIFPVVQLIPVIMAKSASVWNPIVYGISHRRFKRELREIFLEKCCPGIPMTETVDSFSQSMSNVATCGSRGNYKELQIHEVSKASTAV